MNVKPTKIVQTAQGLFVREWAVDANGYAELQWYLVRAVEGTASAPIAVLSGPVTFEVRTAPSKVED